MSTLNQKGHVLAVNLQRLKQQRREDDRVHSQAEKVNVVGAGGTLTAAYEQLRNAAENTEEHLLVQNAIRRFYRQLFIARDESLIQSSGSELVVELTLAGYLPNDHLTREQIGEMSRLATIYYRAYETIQADRSLAPDRATKWVLDVLAVNIEHVLSDHAQEAAFVEFAYLQLDDMLDAKSTLGHETVDFGVLLFAAIHRALLKSDTATIRANLLSRYQVAIEDLNQYVAFNARLDSLIESPDADKLYHVVDRQGAPFRIIRRMIEETPDFEQKLEKRETFLDAYEKQIANEYERVSTKLNRAIVRSIIFLIITKFIVGIAIEVPYDLWAYGEILWVPLLLNLLFPPIYMFALRATHQLPGYANTQALVEKVDAMLYGDSKVSITRSRLKGRSYGTVFSVLYVLSGLTVVGGLMYLLLLLSFSLVHIAIFFVFLSAASFLGFRLSRLIRELEVGRSAQNGMTFIRDLLYLPFVVVGQWMSDKYSKVNIVTIILDMLIELPLKTILRLVRQWGAFIDERKDRI